METLNGVIQAKAKRDVIRDALVKHLRTLTETLPEIQALLRADERATDDFKSAVDAHNEEAKEGIFT